MAFILNIETSTEICSVSISENGKCKFLKIHIPLPQSDEKYSHSKLLAVYIDNVLKESGIMPTQIDAVAVSCGPGSYTGLRIGVSSAKGFAYGISKPLIAIDTLLLTAKMSKEKHEQYFDFYIPMTDARRMEVFCSVYDNNLNLISPVEAKIITPDSFDEFKKNKICFCGNGAEKCSKTLSNNNFIFLSDIYPSAEFMGEFADTKFNMGHFEDITFFEPYYLKDFVATTPKNKII